MKCYIDCHLTLPLTKQLQINSETRLVFHGQHTPLSNFHTSPFTLDGHQFHSAEQYIQYKNACHFSDYTSSEKILQCHDPYDAKTLSRNILNFDKDAWKSVARDACLLGIQAKFDQNPSLLQFLKATKPKKLAESFYDKLWGTGLSLYDQNALKPSHWINQGLLGEILMEIWDSMLHKNYKYYSTRYINKTHCEYGKMVFCPLQHIITKYGNVYLLYLSIILV